MIFQWPGFEVYIKEISFITYLVVFFGGVVASFTPCIYPIIPITISYIGAGSAGSRMRGFMLSLFYVLGIATTYACLGLIAALSGRIFGEISASPWTYIVVGNIFLILGLSMLGVFTISLPAFSAPAGEERKSSVIGAFLVGLSVGLVVGPCTAPALGAVLAYVASRQNIFLGTTLLFTFAFGMGILIIIVGTFTGLLASMPKSGRWLNAAKLAFGILLIICAEYFIIIGAKRL